MNIIIFGEDSFSGIILESLVHNGNKILQVYCPFYENNIHSRLEATCGKFYIPFARIKDFRSPDIINKIKSFNPDLIVVCHFQKILIKDIIDIPSIGCINLHPSLLPNYRGMSPQHFPIINGDSETGVTIHFIDEGIDTGDIIVQKKIEISDTDYVIDIQNKMKPIYASIIIEAINRIANKSNSFIVQKNLIGSYYGRLKNSDCEIDSNFTCKKALNIIRAVSFPYLGARYDNLIIWKAIIADLTDLEYKSELGEVLYNEYGTFLKLKDGYLKLLKFEKNEK